MHARYVEIREQFYTLEEDSFFASTELRKPVPESPTALPDGRFW